MARNKALYNACQAIFNPGDEVIVFSPYWVSFPEFVKMADANTCFSQYIIRK